MIIPSLMTTDFNQTDVSSMSSILSSIENDRQVYSWFLLLIKHPRVLQKHSLNEKTKNEYKRLNSGLMAETVSYNVLALIMVTACLLKEPWALLLGILPLLALFSLFKKNKKCVAAISEVFLTEYIRPDDLKKQTLFQTCEYVSKEYTIPSLVDIIAHQDFTARKVLLATFLFIPFVLPLKTWQILLATLIVIFITLTILNTNFILRRIK